MFATNTSQKDVRKPQMSGDGNDGLPFEFPVIADPTLSTTKDGSTQDISLDILPIDIEDDGFKHKKGSKSVTNMPLWVCGPSEVGRFNFTIYFYYECNKKAKKSFGKRRPLQYRMIMFEINTNGGFRTICPPRRLRWTSSGPSCESHHYPPSDCGL